MVEIDTTFITRKIMRSIKELRINDFWDRKAVVVVFMLLLMGLLVRVSYNHHSQHEPYSYRASLWGDKAGYYIYLPMAFVHGFKAEALDESLSKQFGDGFRLEEGRIRSKYTSGLALLTWPFFLIIHWLALLLGHDASGFSPVYFYLPLISGPFYAALGLAFLHAFLRRYLSKYLALLVPLIILFTTNLLHYATVEAYMSHVYSFALISFFLYILKRNIEGDFSNYLHKGLLCFAIAMTVLVRPTNILIIFLIILLDINSIYELRDRLRRVITFRNMALMFVIGLLCFLPQFLYWQYAYGSWLPYTYEGESFDHWANPQIIPILLAPQNGIIPFAPFFGILLISMVVAWFIKVNRGNSIRLSIVFILALYVISSWGSFVYGCSFGSRPLVDYLPFFAIPFGSVLQSMLRSRARYLLPLLALMVLYSSYFTFQIAKPYDGCFYGSLWQWRTHTNLMEKSEIFPFAKKTWTTNNSFEPEDVEFYHFNQNIKEDPVARSGRFVTYTDETNEFSSGFRAKLFDISLLDIHELEISIHLRPLDSLQEAWIVCHVELDEETVFWEAIEIDVTTLVMGDWNHIHQLIQLPELHKQSMLKIYGWVPGGAPSYFDDMRVTFRYH